MLEEIASGGTRTYPLLDGLGTVRARTDTTGSVTGVSDYDAWGNVRTATGAQGLFGWTGEPRDSATGLTYLRARDYSPGTGRFVQRDTVSPNGPGTTGYNPYAYALNNPITLNDPSGHGGAFAATFTQASPFLVWLAGMFAFLFTLEAIVAFSLMVFAIVIVILLAMLVKHELEKNCSSHGVPILECLQGGVMAIGQGGFEHGRSWFSAAAAGVAAGYEAVRAWPKEDDFPPIESNPPVKPPTPIRPNPPQGGNEPGTGPNPGPGLGPDPVIDPDPGEEPDERNEPNWVVRGGVANARNLQRGSGLHPQGVFGFSVQHNPGSSILELSIALPHPQISVTIKEALEMVPVTKGEPIAVIKTGRGYHHTVRVPNPFEDELAVRVAAVFAKPEANPAL